LNKRLVDKRRPAAMAAFLAFLGMLLTSMVVALLAVLSLGDFFGANEEFGLVILAVMAFAVASLAVLSLVYAVTRSERPLAWVAWLLAFGTLTPFALPDLMQAIAERSTNPHGVEGTFIAIELMVPALLAVLVQWALVRRRWLAAAGANDLTRWPWITTVLAGLILLSPFGLAFLQGTLRRSGGDMLWEFTAMITGVVLGVLLVMAYLECYIRDRILNRRRAAETPPRASGEIAAQASTTAG
jgi:hypothetical protein